MLLSYLFTCLPNPAIFSCKLEAKQLMPMVLEWDDQQVDIGLMAMHFWLYIKYMCVYRPPDK